MRKCARCSMPVEGNKQLCPKCKEMRAERKKIYWQRWYQKNRKEYLEHKKLKNQNMV